MGVSHENANEEVSVNLIKLNNKIKVFFLFIDNINWFESKDLNDENGRLRHLVSQQDSQIEILKKQKFLSGNQGYVSI